MNQGLIHRPTSLEIARPTALAPTRPPTAASGLMQICWRRRWIVIAAIVFCVAGAVAYIQLATPLYTAYAQLHVQRAGPVILNTDGIGFADRADVSYLVTQCSLITSYPVVEAALKELQTSYAAQGKSLEGMSIFHNVPDPIGYVRKNIDVQLGKKDNLISVSLDSPDAAEGRDIANAVVNAYRADQLEQTKSTASKVMEILKQERAAHEANLKKLESAMYEYKKQNPTLTEQTNVGNIIIQKLAKLNEELTQAQILTMYARVEFAQTNAKRMAQMKLETAEKNERQLQEAYNAQQQEALKLNVVQTEYDKLVAQVDRSRKMIDALASRQNEVEVNDKSGGMNIRILQPAFASQKPSKPQPVMVLAIALSLGLMLGTGAAYLRDTTDHRLNSAEEIGAVLGLPVLGLIPSMPGRQTAVTRGQKVHLDSMSDVAEAFRTLRTVVYFSAPSDQAKTFLITSPSPGEGKSTTASGLAIAMAKAGRRTLLVDTDLRKPTLHRIFETDNEVGVSSVIAGKAPLELAVRHTAVEGLDILPCGPLPLNPSELLNSQAFGDLLEKLSATYDNVLLDSPPVLAVTDARILGAVCDLTIVVVRAGVATRRVSEHACQAMLNVGARVLGVVVNDVAPRDRSYYGANYRYGNYGYDGNSSYGAMKSSRSNGNGHDHRRLSPPGEVG